MSYHLSSSAFEQPELPALLKRLAVYFGGQGIPFYVVGAMARDIVLGMIHGRKPSRKTNDLDIAIMVQDWNAYNKISADLDADPEFSKCLKQKQRWYFKGTITLDVVPFGELAKADRHIYWPPDETPAMSVSGFPVMAINALEIILDEEASIGVASLPGFFLLKLSAWKDRRYDRDAQDLAVIMDEYLEINLDRAARDHPDIFEHEDFTELAAGAHLMGKDICRLLAEDLPLREETRSILTDELAKNEESLLIRQILEFHRFKRYAEVRGALALLKDELTR
jgi:predicted nucleotidyltransferase